MALIRRRRQEQEPREPRQEVQGDVPPATSPSDWVPDMERHTQSASDSAPEQWVPEGVASPPPMHRRSSASRTVPPELLAQPPDADATAPADVPESDAPAAAAPVEAAPAPAPAPPAPAHDRDELVARISDLENQIADARGSQSTEQNTTIRMLQTRLAGLEEELRSTPSSNYPSPGGRVATTANIFVIIALFLVIAGSPLFMTRRSICHVHGRPQTHWAVVKPFDASGKARCENQLGGSVLLDSLGLK